MLQLEGPGDLVSRLISEITEHILCLVVEVINLLTQTPWPFKQIRQERLGCEGHYVGSHVRCVHRKCVVCCFSVACTSSTFFSNVFLTRSRAKCH